MDGHNLCTRTLLQFIHITPSHFPQSAPSFSLSAADDNCEASSTIYLHIHSTGSARIGVLSALKGISLTFGSRGE